MKNIIRQYECGFEKICRPHFVMNNWCTNVFQEYMEYTRKEIIKKMKKKSGPKK